MLITILVSGLQCSQVTNRVDCGSSWDYNDNAHEENCNKRGCCWNSTGEGFKCFKPEKGNLNMKYDKPKISIINPIKYNLWKYTFSTFFIILVPCKLDSQCPETRPVCMGNPGNKFCETGK